MLDIYVAMWRLWRFPPTTWTVALPPLLAFVAYTTAAAYHLPTGVCGQTRQWWTHLGPHWRCNTRRFDSSPTLLTASTIVDVQCHNVNLWMRLVSSLTHDVPSAVFAARRHGSCVAFAAADRCSCRHSRSELNLLRSYSARHNNAYLAA